MDAKNHLLPILVICCFIQFPGFSQSSKTNGYQKVFLNNNLNKTDSSNAYFWGYEFYENGKIIAEKFPQSYLHKNCKLVFEGSSPSEGNPIALNGVFKWIYDNNGVKEIVSENTYRDGQTLLAKEFLGGELTVEIDFTRKYNGQEGSCHFTDYVSHTFSSEKRKKTTCYWYRKVKDDWKRVKTPCE